MTIKEFARLCGCNPQTLRYYDQTNLLKPVKVDPWSGYRFYEKEQALAFVRIKNLQRAGFTIGEIKGLLGQDRDAIFEAFEAKIAEQEDRLRELRAIQRSYQSEMNQMKRKLQQVRERVTRAMEAYDPSEEFGIEESLYRDIVQKADGLFDRMLSSVDESDLERMLCGEESGKDGFLCDPGYALVFEEHGWRYAKEFLDGFSGLESGEYALCFEVAGDKANHAAFANTVLGILLEKNPGKAMKLDCTVHFSRDGENHFRLLKRRGN